MQWKTIRGPVPNKGMQRTIEVLTTTENVKMESHRERE